MGDDFIASMGFDSSDFDRGFDKSISKLESGSTKAGASFDKAKKGAKGFFDLAGDRRVETNIGGLAKSLVNAGSGADAAAMALDRLENVFQSSLGVGVVVGVLTAFISKIVDVRAEWKKFDVAMRQTQTEVLSKISLKDFDGAIASAKRGIEELNNQLVKSTGIMDTWARVFSGGKTQEDINNQMKNRRAGLLGMQADAWKEKKEQMNEEIAFLDKKARAEQEIIRLQDTGQKRKAEDLQRQMDYESKLRDIRNSGLPANMQAAQAGVAAMEKSYSDMRVADKRKSETTDFMISEQMKTPQQRQAERLNDAAAARAEDRAIDRSVNKMADQAAQKMVGGRRFTTDEINAFKKEQKDIRAADREKAKRPVKEIKEDAARQMMDKQAANDPRAKDFKAINLIVDVMRNAL